MRLETLNDLAVFGNLTQELSDDNNPTNADKARVASKLTGKTFTAKDIESYRNEWETTEVLFGNANISTSVMRNQWVAGRVLGATLEK